MLMSISGVSIPLMGCLSILVVGKVDAMGVDQFHLHSRTLVL